MSHERAARDALLIQHRNHVIRHVADRIRIGKGASIASRAALIIGHDAKVRVNAAICGFQNAEVPPSPAESTIVSASVSVRPPIS